LIASHSATPFSKNPRKLKLTRKSVTRKNSIKTLRRLLMATSSRNVTAWLKKCDYTKHKLFNQDIQPGNDPGTETPEGRKQKEKEEEEAKVKAGQERVRKEARQKLNHAVTNPNGTEPRAGSFGGAVGALAIEQAGQPVPVEETVENLEELQNQPVPTTIQPTEPAEPTGEPSEHTIDIRRSKRQLQQREEDGRGAAPRC
jgi:hypothetical protein